MNNLSVLSQIEKLLNINFENANEINEKKDKPDTYKAVYSIYEGEITAIIINNLKLVDIALILPYLNLLEKLVRLNLHNNYISDIEPLASLKKLAFLDLSNNRLSNIFPVNSLQHLIQLNVSNNDIVDISSLGSLEKIQYLILGSNKIKDISSLRELKQLKELDLHNNKITKISWLSTLKNITKLELGNNQIEDFYNIKSLESLERLYVENAGLQNIDCISNLVKLKSLILYDNNINDINPLKSLKSLKLLYIGKNKIADISVLSELHNLETLDLYGNLIKDISPVKSLEHLNLLHAYENQIHDISPIKNLKNLKYVVFRENPITSLPSWITEIGPDIQWAKFGDQGYITFHNNPITDPPLEIVKKGKESIKRYFDKINEEGVDYIYEAKLTLVGEGNSGKTSLQKRLLSEKSILPRKDKRTRGIEIKNWQLAKEKNVIPTVHIWDFGGQDVYYPVHRFFITENSVFVLLASTRQTHHNFDYWIPTIYQFGGNSPIILGQTCHEGNKTAWNDLGDFVSNSRFNIIKTQSIPYYHINLPNNNEGLQRIKQTIIDQIKGLPHYGKGVPRSWVRVRNLLYGESQKTACISFEKFEEFCVKSNPEGFSKINDVTDYCQFLHDVGIVLWYSTNEELKNWVILQPEWAMNAVYKIIDDEDIQIRKGHITNKDFDRLWQESFYENRQSILKKMLEIFKIAFPKRHKSGSYIMPARLTSMPSEKRWSELESYLRLEYSYEFMPRGIVNQLSAELSRYIVDENEVWNNATNLQFENAIAESQVLEDFYNRKIIIKARGKDARSLIILIMDSLRNIIEEYKGVDPDIYVPCTCDQCKNSSRPTTFLYNKLLDWASKRKNGFVVCNESGDNLLIEELLYNVGLPNFKVSKEQVMNKTITIFLASSSELKADREQFEIFINRENKRLNDQNVFLKLELWEDFIDAVSRTRLQDEYNKIVKTCDIFVSLFFTKVGRFTAEEFETAFGQFDKFGKPLIYTYFKEAPVNIKEIKKTDIVSKTDFEKKLSILGHYPTSYNNIEDLKFKFKVQLDKILSTL